MSKKKNDTSAAAAPSRPFKDGELGCVQCGQPTSNTEEYSLGDPPRPARRFRCESCAQQV